MSYYAHGYGTVKLPMELTEKWLNEIANRTNVNVAPYLKQDEHYVYEAVYEHQNYHEEEIQEFFTMIPWTEGEMEFTGEDDGHWKFMLENEELNEYWGTLVYEPCKEQINKAETYLASLGVKTPQQVIAKLNETLFGQVL